VDREVIHQCVMVNAPDAFHDVQSVTVWKTDMIGPRRVLEANRVDDQCVSLPPANRMAVVRGIRILGMLPSICVDLAQYSIIFYVYDHPARELKKLHRLAGIHEHLHAMW